MIKKEKQPEKKDYLVEVLALVPTIIRFKVKAETPEQAVELIDKSNQIESPKIQRFSIDKVKKTVARVFSWNSWTVKYIKKF